MEAQVVGGGSGVIVKQGGPWTNEKHLRYLNSMEASFVRTMLENNYGPPSLRLDRFLPDSSDSTSDLNSSQFLKRRNKQVNPPGTVMDGGDAADRRTRRRSAQQQDDDPSQDQVVPQLEKRSGDRDGREPSN